jgi:capsular exopolysaccharide synthesis family protein
MTAPSGNPQASALPPTEFEEEVSISEYLAILLDEWRVVALVLGVTILLTGLYLITAIPIYSASGVAQVSTSETMETSSMLGLMGGAPSPSETEAEILKSDYILGLAIRQLTMNLTQPIPPITTRFGVSLGGRSPIDPNLKKLRRTIRKLTVADWIEEAIDGEFATTPDGAIKVRIGNDEEWSTVPKGGTYQRGGVSFQVAHDSTLRLDIPLKVQLLPDDLAVFKIAEKLGVERIGGNRNDTNLVKISFSGPDRTIVREMVNTIMKVYMDFALSWRTKSADYSVTFIENQLVTVRDNLEKTERQLQQFLEENKAVLLPEQARESIRSSAELELEMRKVQIQEELLAKVIADIRRSEQSGVPPSFTGNFLFDDQLLGNAIGSLNELEMKREAMLADVTESHPEVIKITNELSRIRKQVHRLIRAARKRISDRRRSIASARDETREQLASYPDKQRHLASLSRNQEVGQEMFMFLLTKLEESRILKASTTIDKRIIDRAKSPFRHSKPKRGTILFFSVFVGLFLGIGAVFAHRIIDPNVRDEEDAKSIADLPIYGAIPDLDRIGVLRGDDRTPKEIWDTPKGPAAESFRTIRTNVEFAQVGENTLKVLQITSSEASEGKSTIINNLAIALSKSGHKVILVDLDLRRPSQHRTLGTPRIPGISDHLVGHSDLQVNRVEQYGFDLVTAGNEPPESQRLLASKELSQLIEKWSQEYDYVLLDTPPLLVADSLIISKKSDMMLFVVRPRHCRRSNLQLAKNTLNKMTIAKGLIINGITTRRGGYYHYYRGSYYGSRTSDTQES